MRAMILAAGRGERMGALTASRPKPLLEIAGRTLIERHLDALARTRVREVVVNLAYGGDLIRDALGDGARWNLTIRYSDEGHTALETAGGIIAALPLLGSDPFVLVSADVVTDFDFSALTEGLAQSTLVMVQNPAHHPCGDFGITPTGLLSMRPPLLTYSGIALLEPGLFAGYPAGRRTLRSVFAAAIERAVLSGIRFAGRWIDVGTPERLRAAEASLAEGSAPVQSR
jgi:N-acetyl-alpha-D-muramate 1-phosphate uridylyltransferase